MRLIAGLTAALATLVFTPLVFTAPPATAQQAPTVTLKPNSGKAGSGFTIGWAGFSTCRVITFTWAGAALASSPSAPPSSGQVGATVPADATPGGHLVVGNCPSQKLTARATFTVVGTPPPTTVPPTTAPPVTTRPPLTPTTRPSTPVTTTSPTTPPSTVDTTTPVETPGTTAPEPPSDGDLVLDRPSVNPGDPLSATGKGCTPRSPVTLTSKGIRVGTAIADADGGFTAPVEFTRVEAGRHTITANCGVVLTGAVDQLVTSSTGGQSSTLVILVFFVLAGAALIRFS
ncbi:hypothetical protein [Allokutzneria sp. NRRL B-24872]|uniref:hypothetical protein n=1 Tax=Allokutzneria sp. NRRL B-24872 TaxID=1137961 RepID=UPI001FEF527E|nr:hypothetical protein [Allokutzneria sp. NRRL B-24872]